MRVELDVFSSRPNPSWRLSDAEMADLVRQLSSLPATGEPGMRQSLGYRGLVISNPERRAGLPAHIRVYHGVVTLEEAGRTSHYRDANNVESWLLERARTQGYGPLIDQVIGMDE